MINLDDVSIKKDPDHSTKIELSKNLGLIMKYPDLNIGSKIQDAETEVDVFFQLIKACVDKIYDQDKVYNATDYSAEEVDEFLSSLDVNAFKKIQKFFETTPKLYYETSYVTKEGTEKKVVLQNLNDFFMLG